MVGLNPNRPKTDGDAPSGHSSHDDAGEGGAATAETRTSGGDEEGAAASNGDAGADAAAEGADSDDAKADADDAGEEAADADRSPPSFREYLSIVLWNRLSRLGIAVALVGLAWLQFLASDQAGFSLGAGVAFLGLLLFALGFTRGQQRLKRETRWG